MKQLLAIASSLTLVACHTKQVANTDTQVPYSFSKHTYEKCVQSSTDEPPPSLDHIKYTSTDLNADGRLETFVLMTDAYYCGSGGCTAFICSDTGQSLGRFTVTDEPILLSDTASYGWKDFYVWSNGALRLMAFDGKQYPPNPSLEPKFDRSSEASKAEQRIRETELFSQDGYQLEMVSDVPIWQSVHLYTFSFLHYGDPEFRYFMTVNMKTGALDVETRPIIQEKR